eukprot:268984-Pelagomonas_calceolata.AAC.3
MVRTSGRKGPEGKDLKFKACPCERTHVSWRQRPFEKTKGQRTLDSRHVHVYARVNVLEAEGL